MDQLVIDREFIQAETLRIQVIVHTWDPTALNQDEIDQQLEKIIAYQTDSKTTHLKSLRNLKDKKKFVDDGHQAAFEKLHDDLDAVLVKLRGYKRSVTNTNTPGTSSTFKLEKIKLPKFSGQFSDWQSFHDLFAKSVNDNTALSGAEKMIHLKTCLAGEAATIVSAFEATDANYVEAWKLVKKRYSNKREIIFSHLKKFDEIKPMTAESSAGLRAICDGINECSRSLKVLGVQIQHWDLVFIYYSLKKIDKESKREWLLDQGDAIPTLKELLEFLETRARALSETSLKSNPSTFKSNGFRHEKGKSSSYTSSSGPSCTKCSQAHYLFRCNSFCSLPVNERIEFVKRNRLCFNCLFSGHGSSKCHMSFSCRKCGRRHHTLLHEENSGNKTSFVQSSSEVEEIRKNRNLPAVSSSFATSKSESNQSILLGTVIVKVMDSYGNKQYCRVFVDPGSESSFISENCVSMLGLQRKKACVNVSGIGGTPAGSAKGIVPLELCSRVCDFVLKINALILPKVSINLPRYSCQSSWPHIQELQLGDPKFYQSGPVDILLGAQGTSKIMLPEIIQGVGGAPTAQNTQFGWMLSGTVSNLLKNSFQVSSYHSTCAVDNECLQNSLEKFWKLEEPEYQEENLTQEEKSCEEHFVSTHIRNSDGSYTVELPFKNNASQLGNSKEAAVKRFSKVENRLSRNPKLKEEYIRCMDESISNDFMEIVPESDKIKQCFESYYMPHREVIRESSTTTKVRIVYDASAKTQNGISLNDVLYTGAKLQMDLVPLLIRFRSYPVAMSADIVKFFNQFKVSEKHRDFQRLVWRESPLLPIKDYRMKRVTFGLTCAPYLAIRCLNQLGEDEEKEFPSACSAIKEEFLVDNLLSGGQDIESALTLQNEILEVMKRGKLKLTKWSSNCEQIVKAVPEAERECLPRQIQEDKSIKTIGLLWNPTADTFGVSIVTPDFSNGSKRKVLSSIARIFDPLGWLSPVTIRPKILMQELWKEKLEWDSPLSTHHLKQWQVYCKELELLKSFKIDRCIVGTCHEKGQEKLYEIHGFSDASDSAYAACIYLRTICSNGQNFIRLVLAKTKVAPVKKETTPRLELCGALLLCKLIKTVQASLKLNLENIRAWTDSTIVLDWIRTEKKLPIFVANRVRKIIQIVPPGNWSHVNGEDNPADSASRGITSSSLINHQLWYHGPSWLISYEAPKNVQAAVAVGIYQQSCFGKVIHSCSSYHKMRRIVAYCIRFTTNLKLKTEERIYGPITVEESNRGLHLIILAVQNQCFKDEIKWLNRHEEIKSNVKFLTPFVDHNGILRVGGRLKLSHLTYDQKHPILLPQKHNFTRVVLQQYHKANLHAGVQLLLACVRDQFWILRGRDAAKSVVKNCLVCHRQNLKMSEQLMGQLPLPRVTPSKPFSNCGVDYAGPFKVCVRSGRNPVLMKSYVALFICFSTRAIHLEWVSDLSTPAFIAALTRFISRRGLPSDIYCDGGTNFVGAKNEIQEFVRLINSQGHKEEMINFTSQRGINFHINPPRAPHQGGLWEAGVKSMKYHLSRLVEDRHLSIEEFATLLTQVEACLNSRPISQMSTDPNDFDFLTPGHFLMGESPTALPSPNLTHLNQHRLDRWQAVQQMFQSFWKRWRSDYLSTLQNRPKWYNTQPELKVGDLVIIRDDEMEWGQKNWKMGRVHEIFPGKDGHVRVCAVRIANGNIYKRPVVKLSALPLEYSSSD